MVTKRRSKLLLGRIVVLLSAVVLSVVGLTWSLYAPRAEAAYSCSGKHVYPSQNLAQVAKSSSAGTTFCVHDGTYNVSSPVEVQDRDRFIGIYSDSTRPAVVTSQAHYVFSALGADGVTIKGLKISGAVGGNYCEPACGKGIRGGTHLTVDNAWITGNKNNGIGGTGVGLVVKNSLINHNGSYSFTRLDGGVSQSAGIKSASGSLTVLNSVIRDNYWVGVWCDLDCNVLTVKGSTITGHGKAGIHNEIAEGPSVISGNTIKGNGTLDAADRHAGLLVMSSANVDAYDNNFGGNALRNGVLVVEDYRAPVLSNVKIHDNTMNGDYVVGCGRSGVSCYGN